MSLEKGLRQKLLMFFMTKKIESLSGVLHQILFWWYTDFLLNELPFLNGLSSYSSYGLFNQRLLSDGTEEGTIWPCFFTFF